MRLRFTAGADIFPHLAISPAENIAREATEVKAEQQLWITQRKRLKFPALQINQRDFFAQGMRWLSWLRVTWARPFYVWEQWFRFVHVAGRTASRNHPSSTQTYYSYCTRHRYLIMISWQMSI